MDWGQMKVRGIYKEMHWGKIKERTRVVEGGHAENAGGREGSRVM